MLQIVVKLSHKLCWSDLICSLSLSLSETGRGKRERERGGGGEGETPSPLSHDPSSVPRLSVGYIVSYVPIQINSFLWLYVEGRETAR